MIIIIMGVSGCGKTTIGKKLASKKRWPFLDMVIIIMGVLGCGKTTIGKKLASKKRWEFLDADDFHPQSNKDKMKAGESLTDEDRWPWLEVLHQKILECIQEQQNIILACSALKKSYREKLRQGEKNIQFIYLQGSHELIKKRLNEREDHFFNPVLLDNQFETLEEPTSDEAITINIDHKNPTEIIEEIIPFLVSDY